MHLSHSDPAVCPNRRTAHSVRPAVTYRHRLRLTPAVSAKQEWRPSHPGSAAAGLSSWIHTVPSLLHRSSAEPSAPLCRRLPPLRSVRALKYRRCSQLSEKQAVHPSHSDPEACPNRCPRLPASLPQVPLQVRAPPRARVLPPLQEPPPRVLLPPAAPNLQKYRCPDCPHTAQEASWPDPPP